MKLKSIRIENFQSISTSASVSIRDLTVLVGRNDVGKSTVLKALNLFLNGVAPSEDSSNGTTESKVIAVELAFLPTKNPIIIDEAIETSFEGEGLLDEHGLLRVRREWDTSSTKPTAKTSLRRKSFGESDFLLATEKELIKKLEKIGVETKKANGDEFNNVEKRKKLREAHEGAGTAVTYEWLTLPPAGTNRAKLIHDAVRSNLPPFHYFRADTSLDETDAAIQKYFRGIASEALKAFGMTNVEENIRHSLKEVLLSITSKINAVVSEQDSIEPQISFDWSRAISTSFRTTREGTEIPLAQRGDGFRRIAMMAYFEHLAEREAGEGEQIIFGFEEPETFLHPTAQEQLFEKLNGLCEANHQVLVTSHSPIIVARAKTESLIHVTKVGADTVYSESVVDLRAIADDIGIRIDNQFISLFDKAKVLLLVEGIDDAEALEFTSSKYKAAGLIPATFSELSVAILPIGGCNSVQHWVQLDLLQKLTKPFFIFLDSDKTSSDSASANETALAGLGFVLGKNCAVTKKRALENYILPAALNRLVPGANLAFGDFDQVKTICKQHPLAAKLGGGKVAEKHFANMSFEELQAGFAPSGHEDEFLAIYGLITKLIPTP